MNIYCFNVEYRFLRNKSSLINLYMYIFIYIYINLYMYIGITQRS